MTPVLLLLAVLAAIAAAGLWGEQLADEYHRWFERRPFPPVASPRSHVTVRPQPPFDWASDPEMAS